MMSKMEDTVLKGFLATIPSMPVEKRVKLYIKTRAAKSAAQKEFDETKAQFEKIMELCENTMLKDADGQGVTGFTTPWGTTYAAETMKISIADDNAFYSFVKGEGDLDFFERRVSSTHVQQYMEQHDGNLPPGLNIFRERVMRVRKAGDK
jgi:hypothetical protein